MATHEFTLIVEGPDLQGAAVIDTLFEAGLDDATVGRVGTFQYVDVDRESEVFADAVFSATEAIEQAVPSARVVHLEPDDLVTMSEVSERTGRTRESVRLLISGDRGPLDSQLRPLTSAAGNGCGGGRRWRSGSQRALKNHNW